MLNRLLKPALGLIAGATIAASTNAQLLHDDFNGNSIDTSLWQISAPFCDSSMTESDGNAVFKNRGRLLCVGSLPRAIDVTGSFAFVGNTHDEFNVLIRTDGSSTSPSAGFDLGIGFRFRMQSDTGSTVDNVSIVRHGYPGPSPTLATGTFPLSLNTSYSFRIIDDGSNLTLYINDFITPFLTASEPMIIGNHLGLNNREGACAGSTISAGSTVHLDYINVEPHGAAPAKLQDHFSGSSIDTSLWQVSLPFSGSSVTESGGRAAFDNRGRLLTLQSYSTPMTLTGAFKITGSNSDEFKLVIRTDGAFVNDQFGESANGFMITFRSDSYFVSDEVSIQEINGTLFSGWTGTLNLSTDYVFKVVDDGFTISVFLGDMVTPKAVVQSHDFFGNKFTFYNREQLGSTTHQTLLDYVNVVPAPMQPELNGVVSRKVHGTAGMFDIDLPQTGDPGIECRTSGNGNHQIVFTFMNDITSVSGASTTVGSVSSTFLGPNPNQYSVNLSGVLNAQYVTVSLNAVQDTEGNTGNVSGIMAVLTSDTNGDGHVNASDVAQTKSRLGQSLDAINFRSDINTNGMINASDTAITKSHVGLALP